MEPYKGRLYDSVHEYWKIRFNYFFSKLFSKKNYIKIVKVVKWYSQHILLVRFERELELFNRPLFLTCPPPPFLLLLRLFVKISQLILVLET